MKQINMHHDNLFSLTQYISMARPIWRAKSSQDNVNPPKMDWDLNAGYDKALELAKTGWHDGTERMATALEKLPQIASAPKRTYSVAGSRPSAPRFAAGSIRHMIRNTPNEGAKPIVKVCVAVSANAFVNAENMANYGLAIARYIQEMESSGRRCEVIAAMSINMDESDTRICHSWTVKKASEPMSIADMAFSIGHPACFRRLGFALVERTNVREQMGYGISGNTLESDLPSDDYIILNGMSKANRIAKDYESALAYVRTAINEALGIEPETELA